MSIAQSGSSIFDIENWDVEEECLADSPILSLNETYEFKNTLVLKKNARMMLISSDSSVSSDESPQSSSSDSDNDIISCSLDSNDWLYERYNNDQECIQKFKDANSNMNFTRKWSAVHKHIMKRSSESLIATLTNRGSVYQKNE